jgi:hypothetical protein
MLCRHAGRGPEALAHHLACAVVAALGGAEDGLQGAAIDRAVFGAAAAFPAGLAELCRTTAQTRGVQLDQLLDRLCPDRRRAQEVLEDIVARVRHDTPPLTAVMTMWDPWLAALIAARQGSTDAATALDQHLASYQDADNAWGEIARALRVLSDGTKTVELPGLTNVSVAVVIRASVALQGQVAIPVELWRAYLLAPLIFDLVIAAYGDQEAVVRVRSNLLRARGADALLAVLLHILDGSRAPDLADGLEPAEQAVVTTVLFHIATTETQDPGPGRGVP